MWLLIDFIKAAQGQYEKLLLSLEQHEVFASPTVLGLAQLLVEKSKKSRSQEDSSQSHLAHWKAELDGARALTFPKDPTSNAQDSESLVTFCLEPDIASKWKQCLRGHACTPFMGGMTLFHILLSRWFNEKDIISGALIESRDEKVRS